MNMDTAEYIKQLQVKYGYFKPPDFSANKYGYWKFIPLEKIDEHSNKSY